MLIVAWETTSACNLACTYCRASASANPGKNELRTAEALTLIDQLAPLNPMIIFSGGEPLLRPDIFSLAEHASGKGLRISLATNGILLTPDIVDRIKSSGIKRVSISLDGTIAKTNDSTRGQGCFLHAIKGAKYLQGNIDFQINMTICRRNADETLDMFNLAENLKAKALHFFFLVPTGRGLETDSISAKKQEELLRLIHRESSKTELDIQVTCAPQYVRIAEPRNRQKRSVGCLAGISFLFISRTGDIYPCGYLPLPAGNIRETDFKDIWENSPLLASLRTRNLKGKCGACNYRDACGGCRARAYAQKGDALESDPLCNYLVN
ncbi:MAG: radical SAM protein [Methanotrichaceae archaeon]|nr:radical SAM protein [Methanotrichaceae archaeon]